MSARKPAAPKFSSLHFRGPVRSGRSPTAEALRPRWSANGKELFYFDLTGLTAVEVDGSGSAFQIGSSKQLFRLPLRGIIAREYSPSKDGQRFIAISPSEGSSQSLTLVQNWQAELKKK